MFKELRRAKRFSAWNLVGPALGTLSLFVVLVGLGLWQVQRLQWKTRLLAAIDHSEGQPAVPLSPYPQPFGKVTISGRWLPATAHYGVEVRDTLYGPRMGSQLVAALLRPGVPAVLVLLGWVTDGASVTLPSGEIRVTGYVRPPEHSGWLSARDNAETARFFTLDPEEIGKALAVDVEPFTIVVLQGSDARRESLNSEPVPATQLPRPVNNHLSYAATWFGLAATLLVVFGFWVRKQFSD